MKMFFILDFSSLSTQGLYIYISQNSILNLVQFFKLTYLSFSGESFKRDL